jgi:hypothetical protein
VAVRRKTAKPLAFGSPAAQRRHVGLDPGLINEHQSPWIDVTLPGFPAQPMTRDISAFLFAGEDGFF